MQKSGTITTPEASDASAAARLAIQLEELVKREQTTIAFVVSAYAERRQLTDREVRAIECARQQQTDDLEVDAHPLTAAGKDGVWVSSWIWVGDR